MNSGLTIKNLTFAFSKTHKPLFKNLACSFEQRKLNFISGRNGSGKSTFMRILQGTMHTDELIEGTLSIESTNHPLNTRNTLTKIVRTVEQKTCSMLAQNYSFKENLKLAALPRHPHLGSLPSTNEYKELLTKFDIPMDIPVAQLSGGQRQILAILMILQKPAKILLLDEPTAALDDTNAQMVMQFLEQITAALNMTTLIICHDKDLIATFAKGNTLQLRIHNDGTRQITNYSYNENSLY